MDVGDALAEDQLAGEAELCESGAYFPGFRSSCPRRSGLAWLGASKRAPSDVFFNGRTNYVAGAQFCYGTCPGADRLRCSAARYWY